MPRSRFLRVSAGLVVTLTWGCTRDAQQKGGTPDAALPDAGRDGASDEVAVAGADTAVADAGQDTPGGTDRPRVPYRALAITSGKYHSCALLDDHNVKCWGDNMYGQLGLGDKRSRGVSADEMGDNLPVVSLGVGRRARAIAAGRYTTCAVLEDGAVKCWGYGALLPAGDGSNRGDEAGEMGDNLPIVDLGAGRSAEIVGIGTYRACALLDDGSVKCWSGPEWPPAAVTLPAGTKVIDLVEAVGMCALFDDGTVRQLGLEAAAPRVVDTGGATRFVAGSELSGCAVLETGSVTCWGTPLVAAPRPNIQGSALCVGMGFICGMMAGAVNCAGIDSADVTTFGSPAIRLAKAGVDHTCALLDDRSVRCWGRFRNQYYLGASAASAAGWPAVDLGTRP